MTRVMTHTQTQNRVNRLRADREFYERRCKLLTHPSQRIRKYNNISGENEIESF